jgi:peptide/nickel transport system substrate-binding protein
VQRRTFLTGAAATLAVPQVARSAAERVLRFIPLNDLTAVDPIWTGEYRTRNHGYLVFDTLYGQTGPERGFAVTPQMAAAHNVDADGLVWTITLREGLLFHDGSRVLARDCVASIRRWAVRDPFGQTLMQRCDELRTVDDKTFQFRLKRPFPQLLTALGKSASNMCAMMPERLAMTDPFKQVPEVVGSGPFRYKADERVAGSLAVYERFESYHPREDGTPDWTAGPKVAHFDRIEWHVLPDPATALAALQTGEMDWWELAASDFLGVLQNERNIRLKMLDPTGLYGVLRPNHLLPPFNQAAIRRAVFDALNQTDLMIAANGNDPSLRTVPVGYFAPASPLATSRGMPSPNKEGNFDEMRHALDAAGYGGETVVLMNPEDFPALQAMTEVVADVLTKGGMKVDLQSMDWSSVIQRRNSKRPTAQGGWNMFCNAFSGLDVMNPAGHQALRANGEAAWVGWPSDPELERLRNAWFDAPDLAAQKSIAEAIQGEAFRSVPYYPLGVYHRLAAFRADIAGLLSGIPVFWNVRRT